MGTPVPGGHVITAYYSTGACGSNPYNAYVANLPHDGIIACHNTPVPAGFGISGRTNITSCLPTSIVLPYNAVRLSQVG
ncbi:hypothetical protein GCM10022247_66050 [Allokutzneria multivorans]|uniref:Uncharacterized protein n=1 Tax=Allokutzneria multivorans TaxID=1142134 RepID=A0ABP7TV71_9PSEU